MASSELTGDEKRRGPRRHVLDHLDTPLRRLKWIKARWTVRPTVYEKNMQPRGREHHEYPENNAQDWADLYRQASAAIDELNALRDFAADRYTEQTETETPT